MAPFCSCPASLVSRKFFAVGPGCAKCFFFCCAPLGAATFRRGQSKKKTPPREFFFLLRPRGKAREGEAPLGRHGARAKKTPPRVCFFLLRPRRKAREGEAQLGAGTGPEQKKKHHPETITKNVWGTTSGLKRPGGATTKKKHLFLLRFQD